MNYFYMISRVFLETHCLIQKATFSLKIKKCIIFSTGAKLAAFLTTPNCTQAKLVPFSIVCNLSHRFVELLGTNTLFTLKCSETTQHQFIIYFGIP